LATRTNSRPPILSVCTVIDILSRWILSAIGVSGQVLRYRAGRHGASGASAESGLAWLKSPKQKIVGTG
jgi:hypothetical protein